MGNILRGLGNNGKEKLITALLNAASSPGMTQDKLRGVVHRMTHEPLEARDAKKQLTGEWIIYLPHAGKNYYLCCNTHTAGDQFIHDRIMEHCVREFPELPVWLKEAQAL